MIVDAHAHIFPEIKGLTGAGPVRGQSYGRVRIDHKIIQVLPPLSAKVDFTSKALLANMDWAGVGKSVLLQGPFYGECNKYICRAVELYPDRFCGAAYFDPWAPDSRKIFNGISDPPRFRAIKLECSEATGLCGIYPAARLADAHLAWLWRELEQQGLVLVIDLGAVGSKSYQTTAVRLIAEKHPRLKIVIAHLAQPNREVEADKNLWSLWKQQIELGRLANVWFDSASLPAYLSAEGYPYPSAERYFRMVIDWVGPAKVMWGSDLPGTLVHATYLQLVELAGQHTRFLSSTEQEMVLGGNALNVYGFFERENICKKQSQDITKKTEARKNEEDKTNKSSHCRRGQLLSGVPGGYRILPAESRGQPGADERRNRRISGNRYRARGGF